MPDQLRYSVQRTGDKQTDRNLDLIRATFDQVAAAIASIREEERRAQLEDAKAIASLHP